MSILQACVRSDLPVFFLEALEALKLETVVDIGVPLEGRTEESGVSPALGTEGVLLVLHIVVREAGKLATLPAEVTLVPGHVEWAKEEHSVDDQRELVDVSHLHGVLSLHHDAVFQIKIIYNNQSVRWGFGVLGLWLLLGCDNYTKLTN